MSSDAIDELSLYVATDGAAFHMVETCPGTRFYDERPAADVLGDPELDACPRCVQDRVRWVHTHGQEYADD